MSSNLLRNALGSTTSSLFAGGIARFLAKLSPADAKGRLNDLGGLNIGSLGLPSELTKTLGGGAAGVFMSSADTFTLPSA